MQQLIPLEDLQISQASEEEWGVVNSPEYSIDRYPINYGWFFKAGAFYTANHRSLAPAIKLTLKDDDFLEKCRSKPWELYGIIDTELNNLLVHRAYAHYLSHSDVPVCGDYVQYTDDPTRSYHTIAHVWPNNVQANSSSGSLFLHSNGTVSRSGLLDAAISKERLSLTNMFRDQQIWIFDKGQPKAGGAIYFSLPFKVWIA